MDVSPKQVVSAATACIPFLENDDSNRALMGANMQRQAVPLLNPEAPFVGTGMEHVSARDSVLLSCKNHGIVEHVEAREIRVRRIETVDGKEVKGDWTGTSLRNLFVRTKEHATTNVRSSCRRSCKKVILLRMDLQWTMVNGIRPKCPRCIHDMGWL